MPITNHVSDVVALVVLSQPVIRLFVVVVRRIVESPYVDDAISNIADWILEKNPVGNETLREAPAPVNVPVSPQHNFIPPRLI